MASLLTIRSVSQETYNKILEIINKTLKINIKTVFVKQVLDNRLYLIDVFYSRYYNSYYYSQLRGSIVDVKEEKIFLLSDPYPKCYVAYTPLVLSDSKERYYKGYDGCLIRMFQYNEEIYLSTNRCLNARSNRIFSLKDSRSFQDIMKNVGKLEPEKESIFFEGNYKDYIHFFIIVTKETYLFMQGSIEEKIIYLGSKPKYSLERSIRSKFIEDLCVNHTKIEIQKQLSIKEANEILGFKDVHNFNYSLVDQRLDTESPGFVIRENPDNTKNFIFSEGYDWRKTISDVRKSDKILNIYLYLRSKYVGQQSYFDVFPYIKNIKLLDDDKIEIQTEEFPEEISVQEMDENLLRCMYIIVPRTRRKEVSELKQASIKLFNDIADVLEKEIKNIKIVKEDVEETFREISNNTEIISVQESKQNIIVYNKYIRELLEKSKKIIEEINPPERKNKLIELLEDTNGETVYILGKILKVTE